ncbi:hypothetical protein JKP88DRAFT_227293 [Tribonema minus]|uniref:Uncharacterized protein n=1 Tax=Tribonema minus TaxID=303371 RepID=A0A836C8Y4_9STRA|nr:hypothetical protein JKP88DRAFT_227293 [Tribonema minus]
MSVSLSYRTHSPLQLRLRASPVPRRALVRASHDRALAPARRRGGIARGLQLSLELSDAHRVSACARAGGGLRSGCRRAQLLQLSVARVYLLLLGAQLLAQRRRRLFRRRRRLLRRRRVRLRHLRRRLRCCRVLIGLRLRRRRRRCCRGAVVALADGVPRGVVGGGVGGSGGGCRGGARSLRAELRFLKLLRHGPDLLLFGRECRAQRVRRRRPLLRPPLSRCTICLLCVPQLRRQRRRL